MSNLKSIIALVFFVTYIIVQPVANLLCRHFGPRNFLTAITITWGICIVRRNLPALVPRRLGELREYE